MKSRVRPTYKTKYHVQTWAAYDRALARRGDLTIWWSPAAIAAWEPDAAGTRGAQWGVPKRGSLQLIIDSTGRR